MYSIWHIIAAIAGTVIVMVWWDWTRRVENTAEHVGKCISDIDRRLNALEQNASVPPACPRSNRGPDPWEGPNASCPYCGGDE